MREGYIRLSVLVEQTQGIVQMPSFRSAIQWQSPHEESTYSIYIEDRPAADLHGKRLRKSGRADAGTKVVNPPSRFVTSQYLPLTSPLELYFHYQTLGWLCHPVIELFKICTEQSGS